MPTRNANTQWSGDIKSGIGSFALGAKESAGEIEGKLSFNTRFGDRSEPGTNPEELIGAAHASCFSMAFSKVLGDAGFEPKWIDTTAEVTIEAKDGGFAITKIALETTGEVAGLSADDFAKHAETAKTNCPVSKALAGTDIVLARADLA